VFGGDVCTKPNGRIFPNRDNWYCNRFPHEVKEDFLTRSVNKARDYVRKYPILGDNKVYFNIVPGCLTFPNGEWRIFILKRDEDKKAFNASAILCNRPY